MEQLIGQEKLVKYLENVSIDTFPNSSILIGEKGCGKKLFLKHLADKLNLTCVDITETISFDFLSELYRNPLPRIYYIDLSSIQPNRQDPLLKFFEEPFSNFFVVCLADTTTQIPTTILNRGRKITFDRYSEETLKLFSNKSKNVILEDWLGTILRTPGDIKRIDEYNIDTKAIDDLAELMCTKMNKASLANTISISDKINYKDEFDKLDLNIFLRCLDNKFKNKYIDEKDVNCLAKSEIVSRTILKLSDNRLDKRLAIINMLISLWEIN